MIAYDSMVKIFSQFFCIIKYQVVYCIYRNFVGD